MIYPFDPAWRGLAHEPGRSMWTFPDDYPRRVGDALYNALPGLRRERRRGRGRRGPGMRAAAPRPESP